MHIVSNSFWAMCVPLVPILKELKKNGAIAYLVGGAVRDLVLGLDIKDADIEIHNCTLAQLEKILKNFGTVTQVGKKFGVLKILKINVDWSLPRKDSKGRKPVVQIDTAMTIQSACKRRDLTMNAMAINLTDILDKLSDKKSGKINLEIIDPYNGLKDIKNRQLRAVDDKLFLEDPLRFFRVMQFISRFEFNPHPSLDKLCSNMSLYDVSTNTPLAKERIYEELKKLFLKSRVPSLGFRWLLNINRLREIFPELFSLVGVLQQKKYHPEGDVFEHTMQSIDAGAQLNYFESEEEKLLILYSLLCHDLGKAISTDKDLKCHGHEKKGVSLAQKLMKRLTNDKKFYKPVEKLVLYHRLPIDLLEQNATDKAYKRLAIKLASEVNLRQLGLVSLADLQGRNKSGHEPLISLYHDKFNLFLNKARESFVEKYPEEPVLKGRHLLNICPAGPKMGKLLKRAYNIQIEEGIKDLEELKKQVLKDFKKSIK